MNPEEILNEIIRRANAKHFKLDEYCFKEQLQFVNDKAQYKTAVCSRRSGKTIACASDLVATAIASQNTTSLYITLSRNNAKKIVWPEIKKINNEFDLGGIVNESELSIKFGTNIIYLSGANDRTEIEKFRGLALKKVYIDEGQSFPDYLRDLVDDVIAPALLDYAGTLCLIGTPGPVPTGFFHDASHSEQWSQHHWSFFQNPYLPQKSGKTHEALLEAELKRRGVSIDHPSIQREFFGKWVLDSDSLVFHYSESTNHYDTLPLRNPVYIMGIDYGHDDADAISILAWDERSPDTYLVDEYVVTKQGITPLVAQIEKYQKQYGVSKIVADFGGLGKKISEEISRRHGIPIEPADKARKVEAIELLNDGMRTGRFKAKRTSRFAHDCMLMEWDKDKSTPDRRVVSSRFHSDICDSTLYAYRHSPAYAWSPPIDKPKYGSREWAKEEEEIMFQTALEIAQREEEETKQNSWDW